MNNVKCEKCECIVDEEDIEHECPVDCNECPLCENQCNDNYVPLDFHED